MRGWEYRVVGVLGVCLLALGWGAMGPAAASDQGAGGTGAETPDGPDDQERQRRLMQRYEKMIQFNLDSDHTLPSTCIDSLMAQLRTLSLGGRVAAWADYLWRRGDATYIFGLKPGGYVHEGRLVDDFSTDCILFFYRTTELGRSSSALEAVQFAYGTRFHAASLEEVVSEQGQVDYDSPVHLDYSIDIIRSGIWGKDVTETLGKAEPDKAGSARYEPGSVRYIPSKKVDLKSLRDGDVLFFVTDESMQTGKKLRDSGAIIGHVGIVRIEDGEVYLIHPAAKPLKGIYEGGKVVKVPLQTYLKRVETFKGIMATRIENF